MLSELERASYDAAGHHAALMILPNAICVGASRSGSTSLHEALGRHPDIFAARKEIDFFSRDENGDLPPWFAAEKDALVPRSLTEYSGLFEAGVHHKIRLDTSVSYFHAPIAARIAQAIPDCKIIAILRHPVDQAWSWASIALGHEPTTNEVRILLAHDEVGSDPVDEPLRWHGQYHKHLTPYLDHFPRKQIFVRTFEELTSKPEVLMDLQRFLGVTPIDLDLPHWNRSGANLGIPGGLKDELKRVLPEWVVRRLASGLHRMRDLKSLPPKKGPPQGFRNEMMACWYPDVVPGLKRLGIDVGAWK